MAVNFGVFLVFSVAVAAAGNPDGRTPLGLEEASGKLGHPRRAQAKVELEEDDQRWIKIQRL